MKIEYSKKFLKELSKLESKKRSKIEILVFEEIPENDPYSLVSCQP